MPRKDSLDEELHHVPSDDGKRYDFDFHALNKIKRREKYKIAILVVIILLLCLGLVTMTVLYQQKSKSQVVVNSNFQISSKPNQKMIKKYKILKAEAYKKIALYGEDCHSRSNKTTLCGENAYCRYLQGTYRCDCKQGYIGDGIGNCKDVHFSIDFRKPTVNNIPQVNRVIIPATDELSVCFWYKLAEFKKKWLAAFMFTSVEITGTNDFLIWFNLNEIHVTMRSGSQQVLLKNLKIHKWTHLCWVWESTGYWSLYMSGVKVNSGNSTGQKTFKGGFAESHGTLILGQDKDDDEINNADQMFRGEIAQFFMYHRKLAEDEVFASYQGRPSTQNVTVGWWQFKNLTNGNDIVETDYLLGFRS